MQAHELPARSETYAAPDPGSATPALRVGALVAELNDALQLLFRAGVTVVVVSETHICERNSERTLPQIRVEIRAATPGDDALAAKPEPKFWSVGTDVELLTATTIEEALDDWIYARRWDDENFVIPETVDVHGYAEMELPPVTRIKQRVIEELQAWLDEEFGDQNGGPTDIPPKLDAEAQRFADAVRRLYPVSSCEKTECRTVRVRDYIGETEGPP